MTIMVPVLALVGRPNVGKSTLFNCITGTKDALVCHTPGATRDRHYGKGQSGDISFIVVDTGGITGSEVGIDQVMADQSLQAVEDADIILFVVDAREGLTVLDRQLAQQYRAFGKPVHCIVNKTDGLNEHTVLVDFYELGFSTLHAVSATHNRGIKTCITSILDGVPACTRVLSDETAIRVALIGRPNVGKSTLLNRLLGEERVVVFDEPGTTRDSIAVDVVHQDKPYIFVDTAGIRRRARVREAIEKFSIIKTLQSIELCDVAICLLDATEAITEQDLHMLSYVLDAGKCLVVAINKWDGLSAHQRDKIRKMVDRRLAFVRFVDVRTISAKHGTGVGLLYRSIQRAYQSARKTLSTPLLTRILQSAIQANPPPMIRGRRIKLRYAHAGGHAPPTIIIHGNQVEALSLTYRRFLMNFYRQALKIHGTPIRIIFKHGENPYQDRKNELTRRQQLKKKRQKKHFQKKARD